MSNSADLVQTIKEADLPDGWTVATIEDLVGENGVFVDGDWVETKDQDPSGDVRLVQLADIGDGEYRNKSARFLNYEAALRLGCTFLKKGDVLIARMPDPLGRACIFPGDPKKAVTAVDVAIVRPSDNEFNNRWLMCFVNAPAFRAAVSSMQSGSTRKRISRKNLARIALPVPPRPQQDGIVAEIEKQFSRLDEAVANLKRVKANLKRYKAAVLKAAVEGNLTEEWRKAHPDVEPASELLKRILAERRAKWRGRGTYKEPKTPDTADLPSIPDGWTWATVDQLSELVTKGSSPNWQGFDYCEDGIVFVRSQNIEWGTLNLTDVAYLPAEFNQKERKSVLKTGDVLLNIVGASIGRAAIASAEVEGGNVNQAVAVIRLLPNSTLNSYLLLYIISAQAQKRIHAEKVDVARANFSLEDTRTLPVPLPPLGEQKWIVAEVERRFSVLEQLGVVASANGHRAERLRQAILKQAFSGKLAGDSSLTPEYDNSQGH